MMQKMKVAIVSDRIYPFYMGGYEYYLYKLAKRLSTNHEVTIFTSVTSNPDIKATKDIKIVRFSPFTNYTNREGSHSFLGISKFVSSIIFHSRIVKDFDLVVINSIPYLGIPYLISKIQKKSTVAVTFYEAWYEYPRGTLFDNLLRLVLRRTIHKIVEQTDLIFSISKSTTNSLVENYGATDVITAPLGIDLTFINGVRPSSEKFDIAYLGRLATIKHVEDIIEALLILKRKGIEPKTAIIGDGPLREKLEFETKEKNLEHSLKFFGKTDDYAKYSILKSSRIFIMPSEREGFSISTLEAMSCGCVPNVAVPKFPELFGVSDYVRDQYDGLFYKVNDVGDLSQKINILMSELELYYYLKSHVLTEVPRYDWNKVLETVENGLLSS